jgi:hypothetical protein
MSRARGEWTVARDQRRVESLCQSDVSGVVSGDVVSELPRTTEQIDMGMTVEMKVNQISDCAVRPSGGDVACPHETPESLEDFDVDQVRRMKFVVVAKEAFLDSFANWRLQQELQQG